MIRVRQGFLKQALRLNCLPLSSSPNRFPDSTRCPPGLRPPGFAPLHVALVLFSVCPVQCDTFRSLLRPRFLAYFRQSTSIFRRFSGYRAEEFPTGSAWARSSRHLRDYSNSTRQPAPAKRTTCRSFAPPKHVAWVAPGFDCLLNRPAIRAGVQRRRPARIFRAAV